MSDAMAGRLECIAVDPVSKHIFEIGAKVADTSTTVLITGESGSGKDHLARWIHEAGPRRDAPFLKIDCASLPPGLVESELFGHERGAFTGAVARKPGRFELALEGTILLDEIAALSHAMQSKLLRVIEERKFERLGGNETLEMESRLIASTNADIGRAVRSGYFREDLYFRLNVLVIAIPPLRERRADIRPLAEVFLARLAVVHGREGAVIERAAMQALEGYAWPGNVRELKNAVERALILSDGKALSRSDFPMIAETQLAAPAMSSLGGRSLEDIEKEAVAATLDSAHYHIARAAEILGISRKTLLEKRKKYGLM